MSRIRVTIDHLALKGFDPAERSAIVEGLRTELTRVLADPPTRAAWASRNTPVVHLGKLPFQPGPHGSSTFGRALARAIERSM